MLCWYGERGRRCCGVGKAPTKAGIGFSPSSESWHGLTQVLETMRQFSDRLARSAP